MKEPFIRLCPEVTRKHAVTITRWLRDEEVRKYLSDGQDAPENIEKAMDRVNLTVLTHLFSSGGRFFLVCGRSGAPVGFARLVTGNAQTEMVVVIGDRKDWGRRLGTQAIRESMKIAFFEMRSQKVIARIRRENTRSIHAFVRAGFLLDRQAGSINTYSITMDAYLTLMKRRSAWNKTILITEIDRVRLEKLVHDTVFHQAGTGQAVRDLAQEVGRAEIVRPEQIPPNIVTMNTKALLCVDGEEVEASLVYPCDADGGKDMISVLSPIGAAIIGYGEGDTVEWDIPSGKASIHIRKVIYQPEAVGDYHL